MGGMEENDRGDWLWAGRARPETGLPEPLVLQAQDPPGSQGTSGLSLPRPTLNSPCPKVTCLFPAQHGAGGVRPQPESLPLPLPAVRTFEVSEDFEERLEREQIGSTTKLLTQTDFPLQAYEPKVQVPYMVLPGQCPRKIEIERYGWVGSGRWHLPTARGDGW